VQINHRNLLRKIYTDRLGSLGQIGRAFRFEKCYMNEPLDAPMSVGLTSGNGG
jgi:hypothetical protein